MSDLRLPYTEHKIAEALFFLRRLNAHIHDPPFQDERVISFWLSAFLAAGRSVTFCLQWELARTPEAAERYKAVIENLPASERKWLAFFNEARTVVIHKQGKAPLTQQTTGLVLFEMPKIPLDYVEPFPPPTRRCEEFSLFYFHNTGVEVLEGCWVLLRLLIRIIREFIPGYLLPADPPYVFEVRPARRGDRDEDGETEADG